MKELEQVAKESYRVLKKQGICTFMIGDIRKKGYVLPLGMNSMQKFVDAGFKLKEIIIKEQHSCRSTDYWEGRERKFLMLAHEYIFILEKADDHSSIWNERNSLYRIKTYVCIKVCDHWNKCWYDWNHMVE